MIIKKNKTLSKRFNSYRKILLITLLILTITPQISARVIFNDFLFYSSLTLGTVNVFAASRHLCPNLYDAKECKTDEDYLTFLENRTNSWVFLLENPTEDQLQAFRQELFEHYEKILTHRSLLSKIFEYSVPNQPWALFNEEIKQHLDKLDTCNLKYRWNILKKEIFNGTPPIYSPDFISRVVKLEEFIAKIKKSIQCYDSFQNECSQARQEEQIATAIHYILAFYFFYEADRQIDLMIRFP